MYQVWRRFHCRFEARLREFREVARREQSYLRSSAESIQLIIEEHQIEPCRVVKRQEDGIQAFPGAAFQDKLFRRLKQFPNQGREDAI